MTSIHGEQIVHRICESTSAPTDRPRKHRRHLSGQMKRKHVTRMTEWNIKSSLIPRVKPGLVISQLRTLLNIAFAHSLPPRFIPLSSENNLYSRHVSTTIISFVQLLLSRVNLTFTDTSPIVCPPGQKFCRGDFIITRRKSLFQSSSLLIEKKSLVTVAYLR